MKAKNVEEPQNDRRAAALGIAEGRAPKDVGVQKIVLLTNGERTMRGKEGMDKPSAVNSLHTQCTGKSISLCRRQIDGRPIWQVGIFSRRHGDTAN